MYKLKKVAFIDLGEQEKAQFCCAVFKIKYYQSITKAAGNLLAS